MARLKEAVATSAGGIVIRLADGRPQLVVGMRRRDRDGLTWTLPKGTPKSGETLVETAVREVGEETGLDVEITGELGSIEYWFVQRGTRIHKTVHYYSMEPRGGDLSRHDREFERVRWIDVDEAGSTLTFETERDLVARAARQLGLPAGRRAAATRADRATDTTARTALDPAGASDPAEGASGGAGATGAATGATGAATDATAGGRPHR